jgi:hypothetical protein
MFFRKELLFAAALMLFGAGAPGLAFADCRVGDICVLQADLFGCKSLKLIKQWVDIYVDQDRRAAERFIDSEASVGQCARFNKGDRLRIVRYLGLRRLVAHRAGETDNFILLLK